MTSLIYNFTILIPKWRNFVTEQNHWSTYILYACTYLNVCVKQEYLKWHSFDRLEKQVCL